MIDSLQINVVQEEKEFFELRDEWAELLSQDCNATAFQAWDFLFPHWKFRKNGRQLYLITIRSETGKLHVIAPLWRQIVKKGITIEMIEFIGTRGLDYLDFIVTSEVNKEYALKSIFCHLMSNKQDWDIISLSELRKDSKDIIISVLNELGVKYSLNKCSTCVRVALPDNWEDYKKFLGRSTRKDLNYDENRLDKVFNVDFVVRAENTKDMIQMVTELQEIHQSRWLQAAEKGAFHQKWMKELDKEIITGCAENGSLRYFILLVDNSPVAGLSGFSFNDVIYTHTMSVSTDGKYRKFSIGNVLLQKALKWSIENGYRIFDLSRGDELYKFKFGGKAYCNYRLDIHKNIIWKNILNLGRRLYRLK